MCIPFFTGRARSREGLAPMNAWSSRIPAGHSARHLRKEINASGVSYLMKQGKKKAVHDEPEEQVPVGRDAGSETGDNRQGVDAIRLLQLVTGGVALIILVWFVLHSVLNII